MATTFFRESFLDLKFNNHWVSEYGLVVVSDGSRYSETLFPDFTNTTTTVPGKTGTIYWGTTLTGRTITRKLVTDGMTSRQYGTFKSHFRPGTYAELRFSESEYKYSYAYINESSTFTFVPFESQVSIDGITYTDVVFKGECDITFFLPDPYFYSDYYMGKSIVTPIYDYTTEDWFIESGLPLTTWLAKKGGNIQLALGNWYGPSVYSAATTYYANDVTIYNGLLYTAKTTSINNLPTNTVFWNPYSTLDIKCYHAGNSIARANLNFKKTYGIYNDATFLANLWTDYEIDDIVLTIPRAIRDIKYTYELVGTYSSTWTADNKSLVQLNLQENLDSTVAGPLRVMVNATGSGLYFTTITALKNAIRSVFISGKTYLFSINGIELQCRMQSLSELTELVENQIFIVDDNIADSLNNKYITLPASYGPASDGQLTYTTITSESGSPALIQPEVYFKNTYE